jgi:hypothetical protein
VSAFQYGDSHGNVSERSERTRDADEPGWRGMPLIDLVKLNGPDVARLLGRNERLLDMAAYSEPLIGDESRLARTVDELGPRMRDHVDKHGSVPPPSNSPVAGVDPLSGIQVNHEYIPRLMGGVAGEGAPGSMAGRMWRAVTSVKGGALYCAVTNQRLLVVAHDLASDKFAIIFDVPRSAVQSAIRKGKLLLQRGRVELRFTDGSMKAFTTGMLSTARARSLVATLSQPTAER